MPAADGPTTFADVAIGQSFRLSPPPEGWSSGKLVKLAKMPGWAMPEGWDFILADDPDAQSLVVELLDEPAQMPIGMLP